MSNCSDACNCSDCNEGHRCALETFGIDVSLSLNDTDLTGIDFLLLLASPSTLTPSTSAVAPSTSSLAPSTSASVCWSSGWSLCRSLSNWLASNHHWSLASSALGWSRSNWHDWCDLLWLWLMLWLSNLWSLGFHNWLSFFSNSKSDLLLWFKCWVSLVHLLKLIIKKVLF